MRRFYLSGQNNFGNRGCEALVRSTLELLKLEFGEVEVLVPSYYPELDARQWPNASAAGCRFVKAMPYPFILKVWGKIRKFFPVLKSFYIPQYFLPRDIESDIASCEALILIGGDNISLDYGIESLIWHIRFAQHAQRMGKVTMIWGASIGPFTSEPSIEKFCIDFLQSVNCITVRETISEQYLVKNGVNKNVALVSDSAFFMKPEPFNTAEFWPEDSAHGVLGLNISPLIQKYRPTKEPCHVLQQEIVDFVAEILSSTQISILLIPHVDPLDGSTINSDSKYMQEIITKVGRGNNRIKLAPNFLNAVQLKYVLSKCTYFIGARTHATIGAISSLIPTISIAYSIKAKGINLDLFGNEDFILEASSIDRASLRKSYLKLVENRDQIEAMLIKRIPEWCERTHLSAMWLSRTMVNVRNYVE